MNGTGIPGDSVAVTIGNQTQTVTVTPAGTWTAGFSGPTLPADGTHTATAVFTGGGTTATLTGGGFVIDMTPPPVAVTEGVQSTGDVENIAEYANGVTIGGTTEPGATVDVTLGTPGTPGAVTRAAEVEPDGSWTITFTQTEIAGGERTQAVTIVATDPLGNTRSITETIELDTIAPPLTLGSVASDDMVNLSESQSAIFVSGTATPNTTVTLAIEGIAGTVTRPVDANGNWSHELPAGTFAPGTYTRTMTATTIDAADNPTTVIRTLNIDTEMSVAINPAPFADDNVVNLGESNGILTLTGTAPSDTTRVEVQWLGQPLAATLNGNNGTWSIQFPAGSAGAFTRDSSLTVTAWDAAGNSATDRRPIRIDLETALTLEPQPVGPDNILSGQERSAGFTLDGTAEAGARVFLNLNGTDHGPVTADMNGLWSYTFTPASLAGLTDAQGGTLTAYSIDTAGNRSTTETRSFSVDTTVGNFTFAAPDLMGTVNDGPRDASVLNAAERNAGLVVQGTVEPGATVLLQVGNWSTTIPASATQSGTWTFTLPAEALPQGNDATATITATATDRLGNTSLPQSQTIAIDTVVADFNAGDIRLGTGTDNILNGTEHTFGLPVSGRAEAGATINVTMNGHTRTALVGNDGQWSVTFTPAETPTGDRASIPVQVTATDTAGNTSGPHTVTFAVDTIAPATPIVIAAEDVAGGYRAITTTNTNDLYSFHRVDATGAALPIQADETLTNRGEDRFDFRTDIPDGSYLVINTRDVAGNEANTLFIKNTATGVAVDLTREGLDAFDLTAIDLTRAPDARLTINAQQLEALTGPDHQLTVKGETTDHVTLQNVTNVQNDVLINGQRYDIFTLGSNGAQILLEDDVSRTVII